MHYDYLYLEPNDESGANVDASVGRITWLEIFIVFQWPSTA